MTVSTLLIFFWGGGSHLTGKQSRLLTQICYMIHQRIYILLIEHLIALFLTTQCSNQILHSLLFTPLSQSVSQFGILWISKVSSQSFISHCIQRPATLQPVLVSSTSLASWHWLWWWTLHPEDLNSSDLIPHNIQTILLTTACSVA